MTVFLKKISDALSGKNLTSTNKETILSYFKSQFLQSLQNAVLAGEYCQDNTEKLIKIIEEEFNKIEQSIVQVEVLIVTNSTNWTGDDIEILRTYIETHRGHLKLFAKLSTDFAENIALFSDGQDGKIIDTKKLQLFSTRRQLSSLLDSKSAPTKTFDVSHFEESLFEINIWLAYIDEYLECDELTKTHLKDIREYLQEQTQNLQISELLKLLIDKTEYLLFKIDYRTNHDSSASLEFSTNNAFREFFNSTVNHFADKKKQQVAELEKTIQTLKTATIANFRLQPFHELNRYYHRCSSYSRNTRKKNVDELLQIISNRKDEVIDPFDKIAIKSVRNLLYNTCVSLELDIEIEENYSTVIVEIIDYLSGKNSKQIPFINKLHVQIKEFSESESIPDYYCHKVFLEFLESLLKHLKRHPTKIITDDLATKDETKLLTKIADIISYLEDTFKDSLDSLKSAFRKMKTYEIKAVYLFKSECVREYKWEDDLNTGNLFLDSSYVLPNDFRKISKQIEAFDSFINAQIDPLKNTFEVTISRANIKSEIAGFEKKVKENEIKIVQIVAMFVSIATFVLVNVKIFDGNNPLQSFGIMIGLAGCFFLFNLFFHLIIIVQQRGTKGLFLFIIKSIFLVLTPIIFALFSYYTLKYERFPFGLDSLFSPPKKQDVNSTNIKQQNLVMDSLEKNNADTPVKKP